MTLDEWFRAHDVYHKASIAYNDRLKLVRAERERGNWSMDVRAEYDALNRLQSAALRADELLYQAELERRTREAADDRKIYDAIMQRPETVTVVRD